MMMPLIDLAIPPVSSRAHAVMSMTVPRRRRPARVYRCELRTPHKYTVTNSRLLHTAITVDAWTWRNPSSHPWTRPGRHSEAVKSQKLVVAAMPA
jgi:hypothetical protein